MRISPVSFGSLMVFTIQNDNKKPSVQKPEIIPQMMKVSFNNNPQLKNYRLQDIQKYSEKIDGTVHNAAKNLAEELDNKYKHQLPKGSNKVILTEADFYINPQLDTVKRYFLTAATGKDERKIHRALSKSSVFYVAKFGYK